MKFTAEQLAHFLNGKIEGDPQVEVDGFSKIEEGRPKTISFLANPKYEHYIYEAKSSIVLVNDTFVPEKPVNSTLIRVADSYAAIATLLNIAEKLKKAKKGIENPVYIAASVEIPASIYIGAFSYISENVKLGNNVTIYPQVYIGENVTIGDNVVLYPGVKIYYDCVIGNNCILHAGVVIGSDGFGFAPTETGYQKIAQMGNVVIEDDVEIGANTAIDRATMESTVIRKGVKIDNLVQIAHNVEIGSHTVIAAQTGIAGSTHVGQFCMFGGQVGMVGHIKVGNNVTVAAKSCVTKSTGDNVTLMGFPGRESREYARSLVYIHRLPTMDKEMTALKEEVAALKQMLEK